MLSWLLLLTTPAWAQEVPQTEEPPQVIAEVPEKPKRPKPKVRVPVTGHLKAFTVPVFPYELGDVFTNDPLAQAFFDARLNFGVDVGDFFTFRIAEDITFFVNSGAGASSGPVSTGVGLTAPEAFPLTWWVNRPEAGEIPGDLYIQGRLDRFYTKFSTNGFDATIGRQPISFGHGVFFTPLDLVSPFTPANIDTEYKPGVDSVRLDGYFGTSGKVTAVAAYTGSTYIYEEAADDEPSTDRYTLAAYGQGTVGVTDLGAFYGFVRGDHVIGATMVTGIGPVGLHADATVTIPREDLDEDIFFRGVVGVDGTVGAQARTTLAAEVYVQTWGTTDKSEILSRLASPRIARGELWLTELAYLGLSWGQEITPLIRLNVAAITNLTDPSVLFTPGLYWDVSSNSEVYIGGFFAVGKRPELVTPSLSNPLGFETRSEFGLYPVTAFAQISTYF